jgi:hypothetical protein
MSYESQRYERVENFRVEEVSEAYFYKPNPLYKPRQHWQRDEGFSYAPISLPKGKYATVEEALEAVRKKFHVRC